MKSPFFISDLLKYFSFLFIFFLSSFNLLSFRVCHAEAIVNDIVSLTCDVLYSYSPEEVS